MVYYFESVYTIYVKPGVDDKALSQLMKHINRYFK